jgi:hypothetical protein
LASALTPSFVTWWQYAKLRVVKLVIIAITFTPASVILDLVNMRVVKLGSGASAIIPASAMR